VNSVNFESLKTPIEKKCALVKALDSETASQVGPDGLSLFDITCNAVKSFTHTNGPKQILEILLEIVKENSDKGAEWWLSFICYFDSMMGITDNEKLALVNIFMGSPPKNNKAQLYFLRELARLGAALDFNSYILSGSALTPLAKSLPLLAADTFVWANKFEDAERVVRIALREKLVVKTSVRTMIHRWESHVSPTSGANFLKNLKSIVEPENAGTPKQESSIIDTLFLTGYPERYKRCPVQQTA